MLRFSGFDAFTWASRLLLAQGVILTLFLLNVATFAIPYSSQYKPFFLLMAIYYWAIYRPTVLPVAYTFILGLLLDLLTGLPPGLNALLLIVLQTIVQRSRLFLMGQPFMMVWLGFVVISLAYATLLWFGTVLASGYTSLVPALISAMFSVLIFPLVSFIMQAVHKLLPISAGTFYGHGGRSS